MNFYISLKKPTKTFESQVMTMKKNYNSNSATWTRIENEGLNTDSVKNVCAPIKVYLLEF